MNLKIAFVGVLSLMAMGADAHDFSVTIDEQRLYFDITNKAKRTVAVTYNGSISNKKDITLSGKIGIPSKVKHNNVIYEVTAINPKAFAGAKRLKAVVIPSGVDAIGDFAFEGCDSLTNVVFPGNPMSLGQGVFFKCSSISDVTIGSDWKTVDFTMFRWSNNLTQINIPAKIEKVQGVKKLKFLTTIIVDPNNDNFSSYEGLLYNKNGEILYACPRAHVGKVRIKEGTIKITDGALIDCTDVTMLDFPSTLQSLSFRETSRMKVLETIIMRPVTPIITAFIEGYGRFLLQLANDKTQIVIPSSSKKSYEKMMASIAGEYSETVSGIPYTVSMQQIPVKKHLKAVKNFDKY